MTARRRAVARSGRAAGRTIARYARGAAVVRSPRAVPIPADPPELVELDRLLERAGPGVLVEPIAAVECAGRRLPVTRVAMGRTDRDAPIAIVVGGVHGLERIGSAVVLSFLATLLERLRWDDALHRLLEAVRIVLVPVVNPGGLWRGTRANPAGVDLMRNAPVESDGKVPWLVGGQRIGPALPWYRGAAGEPMQPESAALCAMVERELGGRPFAIAVDCHSGFGVRDRIWFPYARSPRPIEHVGEMLALARLFERTHPSHRYVIEPQSAQYLAHGDLWDHLYAHALARGDTTFLPLTLEMGSWSWVRKNPRQLFSRHGLFNPQVAHRHDRVLRRHGSWLDFAVRAAASHRRWVPAGDELERARLDALERWWRERPA